MFACKEVEKRVTIKMVLSPVVKINIMYIVCYCCLAVVPLNLTTQEISNSTFV